MQLLGKRSLAWVLKWITTVAIVFWAAILLWVLPVGVRESSRSSFVVPAMTSSGRSAPTRRSSSWSHGWQCSPFGQKEAHR